MITHLKFNADHLIPAVVQDAQTKRVLMLAWMNESSIRATLDSGFMNYWSRSRQKLWVKGATSGHSQRVVRWFVDCDKDSLLFEIEQTGGACHTGFASCFFQEIDRTGTPVEIAEAKVFDPEKTYGEQANHHGREKA